MIEKNKDCYKNPVPLFLRKFVLFMPFNPRHSIVEKIDKRANNLLDVGCGHGGNIIVLEAVKSIFFCKLPPR